MTDKQDFEDIETRRENRTRASKTRLYALGAVVGVIAIGGVAATGTVLSSDNSEARDEQRMKAVSTFYSDSCYDVNTVDNKVSEFVKALAITDDVTTESLAQQYHSDLQDVKAVASESVRSLDDRLKDFTPNDDGDEPEYDVTKGLKTVSGALKNLNDSIESMIDRKRFDSQTPVTLVTTVNDTVSATVDELHAAKSHLRIAMADAASKDTVLEQAILNAQDCERLFDEEYNDDRDYVVQQIVNLSATSAQAHQDFVELAAQLYRFEDVPRATNEQVHTSMMEWMDALQRTADTHRTTFVDWSNMYKHASRDWHATRNVEPIDHDGQFLYAGLADWAVDARDKFDELDPNSDSFRTDLTHLRVELRNKLIEESKFYASSTLTMGTPNAGTQRAIDENRARILTPHGNNVAQPIVDAYEILINSAYEIEGALDLYSDTSHEISSLSTRESKKRMSAALSEMSEIVRHDANTLNDWNDAKYKDTARDLHVSGVKLSEFADWLDKKSREVKSPETEGDVMAMLGDIDEKSGDVFDSLLRSTLALPFVSNVTTGAMTDVHGSLQEVDSDGS